VLSFENYKKNSTGNSNYIPAVTQFLKEKYLKEKIINPKRTYLEEQPNAKKNQKHSKKSADNRFFFILSIIFYVVDHFFVVDHFCRPQRPKIINTTCCD